MGQQNSVHQHLMNALCLSSTGCTARPIPRPSLSFLKGHKSTDGSAYSACKLVTQTHTWVVHLVFRLTKASDKGGDCKAKWRDLSQHLPSTDCCLAFHQTSFMQAGTSSGSAPTVSLVPGSSVWHRDVSKYICFFVFHLSRLFSSLPHLHKVLHACHFLLFKCQRKTRVSTYLW